MSEPETAGTKTEFTAMSVNGLGAVGSEEKRLRSQPASVGLQSMSMQALISCPLPELTERLYFQLLLTLEVMPPARKFNPRI
jgi:hypothetical protein